MIICTGTGRPLSGTFIEIDGSDNNASTSGYAPFYANSVYAVTNTWGTHIPNNLANGVNNLKVAAFFNSSTM